MESDLSKEVLPFWIRPARGTIVILPKWFLLSRLETRTKESNLYASVRVEKLIRGMKVKGAQRKRQHRPT